MGKPFQDDLKMHKSMWFYHPVNYQRCLLLFFNPKKDANQKAKAKEMEDLANENAALHEILAMSENSLGGTNVCGHSARSSSAHVKRSFGSFIRCETL